MKKILLSLMVVLTIALSACETTTQPSGCAPGYEDIEGVCTLIEVTPEECEDDEILVDDKCVLIDNEDEDLTGPVYLDQGYDLFENRDIVSTDCSHLDNIGEWQPVWCDEFSYTGLPDSNLWGYDVGGGGFGNGESQYYTNADIDNAFVSNGVLNIKAIKESHGGNDYTSARLISKNKGDFTYGKILVRAKVPTGKGTWPAIWMLPTDWEYGGWPTSGEIDIMEYVGYNPNVFHGTIHTGAFNHSANTQIGKSKTLGSIEEEFHVYEIEWEPNIIRFYVNGSKYFEIEYDPDTMYRHETFEAWPFDKDFHLLLNLAIGGAWGGAQGIDDSIFPQTFKIDYVRVYQKDYTGMDTEAPAAVTNGRALDEGISEAFIAWDIAVDDVMTKEYEIYQDDVLIGTSTHNGYRVKGLSSETSYAFKVVPVDFAGNKGNATTINVTTSAPKTTAERIEAEDYISMSGIQLETTQDTGGGENVGYIDTGDYLTYSVNVIEAGNYTLSSRVASQAGGTSFDFLDSANEVVFSQSISATGGWQNWTTLTSESFYMPAGMYEFKIKATGSGFNLNYFEFTKVD